MKRVSIILTLGLIGFLVMGADHRDPVSVNKEEKKVCRGYTIIEAGKGIDCNGDTLSLARVGGFYERIP